MPLSISNSSNKKSSWLLTWLIVIVASTLLLGTYEYVLKKRGFLPSVESSKDIWSWYRAKTQSINKKIVLLGASRSLLGINTQTIRQMLPDYEVIQLSLNGKYPIATLIALSEDENFHGDIIVSSNAQSLEKALINMQQEHNQYFNKNASWYKSFDAYLKAYFESRLRLLHPSLGIKDIVEYYDKQQKFQSPFYISNHLDLSTAADYSKTNAEKQAKNFISRKTKTQKKHKVIDPDIWLENTKIIQSAVIRLKNRDNQVIFVRFPTDKGYWALEDQYYPRSKYWDLFANIVDVPTVHFNDVFGMNKFDLPDTNHIDQKDTHAFTEILINHIIKNEFLTGS